MDGWFVTIQMDGKDRPGWMEIKWSWRPVGSTRNLSILYLAGWALSVYPRSIFDIGCVTKKVYLDTPSLLQLFS